MKFPKRINIPDVYIGFLILPVIGLIALIAECALPLITALIKFFHHN